jgi:Protein of unknown function (DUF2752)
MTYEWRHLRPRELDQERLWASVALACIAILALSQVSTAFEIPVPLCPLKHVTGIPCPTCGGTRALRALAHGTLFAALRWNPLVAVAAVVLIPCLAYAAVVTVAGWPRFRVLFTASDQRLLRAAAWAGILANWAFLVIDGR